jgi:hypothetical protein
MYIETVRTLGSAFPRHERRVIEGPPSWEWGWGTYLVGYVAATDFQGEIYTIRSTYGGSLYVSPAGNCFANQS